MYVCMTLVASLFARFCPVFCSMWSKLCSANLVHCQTSRPKFKREVCSCAGSLASICCFLRTFSNQVCSVLWWLLLSSYFSFVPSLSLSNPLLLFPFLFPFICFNQHSVVCRVNQSITLSSNYGSEFRVNPYFNHNPKANIQLKLKLESNPKL